MWENELKMKCYIMLDKKIKKLRRLYLEIQSHTIHNHSYIMFNTLDAD